MRQINKKQAGFTMVELLTTLAIIALLIGLLIPALSMVRNTAMTVKQKAQFNAISVALEAFSTDIGDYPPSNYVVGGQYCGANKLAEALVGLDGFGFHPSSQYNKTGTDLSGNPLYYPDISSLPQADQDNNRAARKGPYLELENANAVQVGYIYPTLAAGMISTNYVLADMFGTVKHLRTQKRTGMPILYYKADTSKIGNYVDTGSPYTNTTCPNVYNIYDNQLLYQTLKNPSTGATHPQAVLPDGMVAFHNRIANPNFPGANPPPPYSRPYRSQSFILQSAGLDGLYGTGDDVFNIDENEK